MLRVSARESTRIPIQPKRAALLAYLGLGSDGEPCPRASVLGLFWPDRSEARARADLRKAIHELRAMLGAETVRSLGDYLQLDVAVVRCDALEFRDHVRAGRDLAAVSLYTNDLLQGYFAREPELERWIDCKRRALRDSAYLAALRLAKADADSGNWEPALFWARRAEELSSDREEATRFVMTLLHQSGNRAAALARYAQLVSFLSAEYAVGPSKETVTIANHIRTEPSTPVTDAPGGDFYKELVESAAEIIFTTDVQGYFTYVNAAGPRLLGYSPEEIVGRVFTDFIRVDQRAQMMEFYLRQLHERTPVTYKEFPVIRKDGTEVWLAQSVVMVLQDGVPAGMRAISRDITARKLRERAERRLTPPFGTAVPALRS